MFRIGTAPGRLLLTWLLAAMLSGCSTTNPYFDPAKAHHRPNGFANSDVSERTGGAPLHEILWRRLRGDFRPLSEPQGGYAAFAKRWQVPVDTQQLQASDGPPRITWLGHATMLLQVAGRNILIDPNLSSFAGPTSWLSAKRRVPSVLSIDQLPPIHLVLISHNHYDHLDQASIEKLLALGHTPKFIVPLGVKAWFTGLGIDQVQELDWWDHIELGNLDIHFTPAQHWSKRTPFDTNASLWGGFFLNIAVDRNKTTFFYTGDTGYSQDFKEIRRRLGPVDLLAVPIGAYEPREFMRPQHNNPDEAVQIAEDTEARHAIGVHWGSFAISQENFDQPPQDLAQALSRRQIPASRFWMLRQGETRLLPLPHPAPPDGTIRSPGTPSQR
jgi:N-acyl-phosphatidylethanolamine-hydrolysing phospholipase D